MKNYSKDFSKSTVKSLNAKGIIVTSGTWVTGTDGNYSSGETGYILNDNGTQIVRSYLQVVELAK